jgi:hypothetical protein
MKTKRHNITMKESPEGASFVWKYWRLEASRGFSAVWMLESHDGAVRTLENTWADSVPIIKLIASNYGLQTNVS